MDFTADDDATDDKDNDGNVEQLGFHASWRNDDYLIGAFAGVGRARVAQPESGNEERGVLFGIEGQYYTSEMTYYGQLGLFNGSANDEESLDSGGFGRVGLRYFLDPNSFISGNLLYGAGENANISGHEDIDYYSWDISYRQGIADIPISWFVAYNGNRFEIDAVVDEEDLTEHFVLVGLTITFGPASLRENDRRGATLDVPTTPLRAAGYSTDVID